MDGDREFGIQSFTVKLGQKKVSKIHINLICILFMPYLVAWKPEEKGRKYAANGLTSSEFSVEGILAMR